MICSMNDSAKKMLRLIDQNLVGGTRLEKLQKDFLLLKSFSF